MIFDELNERFYGRIVDREGNVQPLFDDRWGEVPEGDRHAWSRAILEYAPFWPGHVAAAMTAAGAVMRGEATGYQDWLQVARDLNAVGFSPTDYLLLSFDLHVRLLQGTLEQAKHGHLFSKWGRCKPPYWELVPIADAWAEWPLVALEKSPQRATDYVLSGGAPSPLLTVVFGGNTPVITFDY